MIELIFFKATRSFTKNKLLYKYFQNFSQEYQNIFYLEQLYMGHSWPSVSYTPYVEDHPILSTPTF